jgi:pimeloyl-ACP methyl ester carboxylesterase
VGRGHVHEGTPFDLPRADDGWPRSPYTLARMAADHVEVLDHLGVDRAHVLGVSMGGMIAQHVALAAPERTASLVSVMSTTGARGVGHPTERAKPALTSIPPHGDLDAYVTYQVELQEIIGTPGEAEPERAAARARVAFARGVHEWGSARQLLAIRGDGDRTAQLAGRPRADARPPRGGRPADRRLGRARHRRGHPRRAAGDDPGLGARPARGFLDRLLPPVLDHLAAG